MHFFAVFFILALPVQALSVDHAVKKTLNRLAKSGGKLSMIVTDVKSNRVVASFNADERLNPASNIKLATAAAALHILKPEHRFKTEYYIDGPIVNGALRGDLIVKGYGDPTIVTERLYLVARELYLRGLRRIKGKIILDESFFDEHCEAKGFKEEEKAHRAYAASVGALSVNHNSIGVFIKPTEVGENAILALDPHVSYAILEGSIKTVADSTDYDVVTKPVDTSTGISVVGKICVASDPIRTFRRIYHPADYFASILMQTLEQQNIRTSGEHAKGAVTKNASLFYTDFSPTLAEVVMGMNQFSNNFVAEMLVKALGAQVCEPASFDNGLAQIERFLRQTVGLKKESFVLGNGSGLNDSNRFSARQINRILTYAYRNFEIGPEFVASLSVAGSRGTLKERMKDLATQRRLRAKTGLLTGVSALSGFVEAKDKRVLAFSILMQGGSMPIEEWWNLQDELGKAFAMADDGVHGVSSVALGQ